MIDNNFVIVITQNISFAMQMQLNEPHFDVDGRKNPVLHGQCGLCECVCVCRYSVSNGNAHLMIYVP